MSRSHSTDGLAVAAPSRRDFLRGGMILGTGLVIGFHGAPGRLGAQSAATGSELAPNAFVRVAPDDIVTVVSKHIEFGQGTYTGLATMVAEELDADWWNVRVVSSPADTELYKNLMFGVIGTGGSTAMANSWEQYRKAGATARALLVEAAAAEWGVPVTEITVREGVVHHEASGREARFGALAERAAGLEPPAEVTLKDPSDFRYVGESLPRVDVPEKSNGAAIFTIDVQRPGLLTALLERPPRFGATVAAIDDSAAKKVPGVVHVVEVPRGVAVVAKNFWAAKKGRDALRVDWDESNAEFRGSDEIMTLYRELAERQGTPVRDEGDAEKALADAATVIEADFEFPFLAHAPMETLDAVAEMQGDGLKIWAGAQLATVDQMAAAQAAGLPPEKVEIETMLAGGSFGRRATPDGDVIAEAASVVKAIGGTAPVKVVWTREDDIRGGRYRPAYFHRIRAGLDAAGDLVAWHQRIVGQSIQRGTPFESFLVKHGVDDTSVEGASTLPYSIPNFHVDLHTTTLGIPPLWWRSVGHTHTAYSTEMVFDELAEAAGKDPVAWRLELLDPEKYARERGVLEAVAEAAGWADALPEGRARGVALHKSFNSYVAQIAEVSAGEGDFPKVEKVWCAVDCGIALNPDNVRAQMEGGIGYGLGAVLFDEVVIENGVVQTANFDEYRSLRIHEMPEVEVVVVASTEAPTGVGEPGVPPIGPAVANAWARLTGTRVRRLPFTRALGGDWT